jgi:transposase-like protein
MVLVALTCPFCGSENVDKNEDSNGKQRYLCKKLNIPIKNFIPNTLITLISLK